MIRGWLFSNRGPSREREAGSPLNCEHCAGDQRGKRSDGEDLLFAGGNTRLQKPGRRLERRFLPRVRVKIRARPPVAFGPTTLGSIRKEEMLTRIIHESRSAPVKPNKDTMSRA
ncbi:MAG: hypothetical protein ABFD97_05945 [Syntrophobacter sp.]